MPELLPCTAREGRRMITVPSKRPAALAVVAAGSLVLAAGSAVLFFFDPLSSDL